MPGPPQIGPQKPAAAGGKENSRGNMLGPWPAGTGLTESLKSDRPRAPGAFL